MLFNDYISIEVLITTCAVFYVTSTNLTILLYTAGIYLISLGTLFLLSDSDIYVGFLWVIDLGVGLIFFIFILHFSSFLNQKSTFAISSRHFLFLIVLILSLSLYAYLYPVSNSQILSPTSNKVWFFKVTYLDYYCTLFTQEVTELNLLKDSYFFTNSFEFFAINFSLLYGLIASILLTFLIQRTFSFLNFHEIIVSETLSKTTAGSIIRNQNYNTQVDTAGCVQVVSKKTKARK